MKDIKQYNTFVKIELVNKGWSRDKKYYIETKDGDKLLLRVTDISEYDRKKAEFGIMKKVAELGFPMSMPVDFGICGAGKSTYSLFTWCEGNDAKNLLPQLTETEQYVLGLKSGHILKIIHSIAPSSELEDWSDRFNRKTNTKIEKYRACGIKFEGDNKIIEYIENNRHLLNNRPQCYQHGDYHVGNMIINSNKELSIIDFNRYDFGDPWEEFNRIVWSATVSPHFATGQLNGYFGGRPPLEFFKLLAFYISSNTLSSIYWAIPFGDEEVNTMKNQARDVLSWFHNMQNPVASWYQENFYIQYIDGIPFKLKAPYDFSFIKKYGKVFKVFDDQDSGNICFGVENSQGKYFVKFAGAPTERACRLKEEAINTLMATVPVYEDLAHQNLIRLDSAEEIGGGFAAIFDWVDTECMGRMYPLSRQKFMQLSIDVRLKVFDDILEFHLHVIDKGYVAIDFYDGSIMYDFEENKTILCDIDFYSKMPYINKMGRLWGSSRFMSPEEFQLNSEINEITNVYLMGATAFALFADYHRTSDKWQINQEFYKVASKAVSDSRNERQQSLKEFISEWRGAK